MIGHKRRPVTNSTELGELEETADHVRDDPSMKPVSMSMAVLAVVVATVSLLGHRKHTEEILIQNQITNGWAHYQAKSSRGHESEMFSDLAGILNAESNTSISALKNKYNNEARRYTNEKNELSRDTRRMEKRIERTKQEADRYDIGEGLLEIALVITSITLLTGGKIYWCAGLLVGIVGVIVAASGWYIGGCSGWCDAGLAIR